MKLASYFSYVVTFFLRLLLLLLHKYSSLLCLHEVFIPIAIQVSISVPLFSLHKGEAQIKDPVLKEGLKKGPSVYI